MSQILNGEFRYPHAEGVIFGAGCFRERFSQVLEQSGVRYAFLITSPSIVCSPLLSIIKETIGECLVGEFTQSCAHTPRGIVLEATRMVKETKQVDVLISLGGSSVIDLAKGVTLVLSEGENLDNHRIRLNPKSGMEAPRLLNPKLPHIALPTTLSGSEFTNVVGMTDERRGRKDLFLDPKLTPRWVFLDSDLTSFTPPLLWAGTGMKVFSDCLEELCSLRANPYSDALALEALNILYHCLPVSSANPNEEDTRIRCQFASFMTIPNIVNTGLGIVSGLRHQIGAGFGVPHGVASTIILPNALRWNLPFVIHPLSKVASRLGIAVDEMEREASAIRLIEGIEALIRSLGLPGRLRDVGVTKETLQGIAEHTAEDFLVTSNPRPVSGAPDLMEVLNAAW